jgi:uncharacterized phage-like protein YoqJ
MGENSCCFTGHRKISEQNRDKVSKKIKNEILRMVKNDVKIFYAGGALGFDTIAAQAVIEIRKEYPDIKLILLLPCKSQCKGWSKKNIIIYEQIKSLSDEIFYISDQYTYECMFERNRLLVEKSGYCICYLLSKGGGTAYTVKYAQKRNLKIINIAE